MSGKKRRLIDADALKESIDEHVYLVHHGFNETEYGCTQYGLHQIIDEQPTIDAEPQWIPCSELLPEDDRSKVVTLANGNTEVGYYSNGDWWCVGDSFSLENPTVIAWMPLPKPYEGDKE